MSMKYLISLLLVPNFCIIMDADSMEWPEEELSSKRKHLEQQDEQECFCPGEEQPPLKIPKVEEITDNVITEDMDEQPGMTQLAPELLLNIFKNLGYRDLINLQGTSRNWRLMSSDKSLWETLPLEVDATTDFNWPAIDNPRLKYELLCFGDNLSSRQYKGLLQAYPTLPLIHFDLAYGVIFETSISPQKSYEKSRVSERNIANLDSVTIHLKTAAGRILAYWPKAESLKYLQVLYSLIPFEKEGEKLVNKMDYCGFSYQDLPIQVSWKIFSSGDDIEPPPGGEYGVIYWTDTNSIGWKPMYFKHDHEYITEEISVDRLFPGDGKIAKTIVIVNDYFSDKEGRLEVLESPLKQIDFVEVIDTHEEYSDVCDLLNKEYFQ